MDNGTAQIVIDSLLSELTIHNFVVEPWWTSSIWKNIKSIIANLQNATRTYDYAVFLGWPDDTIDLRDVPYWQTRDNVIFEFGLFLSELGTDRTFFLIPKIKGQNFRLLSDIGPSVVNQNYSVSSGPPFVADRVSLESATKNIANYILNDVRRRLSMTVESARTELTASISNYLKDLDNYKTSNMSDTVSLNAAKRYISEIMAYKAKIVGLTVDEVTTDLATYYRGIDDLLNIRQLAEKQRFLTGNPITAVVVYADEPLEFIDPKPELRAQIERLRQTVAQNIENNIHYTYIVGSDFMIRRLKETLADKGVTPTKLKQNVDVIVLSQKKFGTYYTIHAYGGDREVYMSSLQENRDDTLIKVSNIHTGHIRGIIENLIAHPSERDGVMVRDRSRI